MKNNPFIYLRGLKHVSFSVFCVGKDGQKSYYDPLFNTQVPYSSGQQVKRSIIGQINDTLGVQPSPTEFYFDLDKKGKKLNEGEVLSSCDPHYVDQLLGGWMRAKKKPANKGKKKDEEEDESEVYEKVIKRRSPSCFSAMKPLHSLLANLVKEDVTFDRSDRPNYHKVEVRYSDGKVLTDEQINDFLENNNKSLYRKWIPNQSRATGLFINDVIIDMRRLFCVSINEYEAEVTPKVADSLKADGWKPINTVFGECLLMPKEQREKIIPIIADALLEWRIDSNQSRTFDTMETLAVTITDNANILNSSIRSKITGYYDDEETRPKVKPIVDTNVDGANTYITLAGAGYFYTNDEDKDALKKAKKDLIDRMLAFDYENQM